MVNRNWQDLAKLADLAFEAKAQMLALLRAQETSIEMQRDQLAVQDNQALTDFSGAHPSHWHDGHFHWQEWVSQNFKRLAIEQAKVRAQAEMQLPDLRKSFGRKTVLNGLAGKKTH